MVIPHQVDMKIVLNFVRVHFMFFNFPFARARMCCFFSKKRFAQFHFSSRKRVQFSLFQEMNHGSMPFKNRTNRCRSVCAEVENKTRGHLLIQSLKHRSSPQLLICIVHVCVGRRVRVVLMVRLFVGSQL